MNPPRAAVVWPLAVALVALAGCGGHNNTFNPTTIIEEGQPDFVITVSPTKHKALAELPGTGFQGDPLPYLVTVRSVNGFSSPVTLSLNYSGPGTFPVLEWSTTVVTPTPSGATATLSIGNGYDEKVPIGIYPMEIKGVGGGLTRTVNASLVVTGYSMTIQPRSQFIPIEDPAVFTVTFTPLPASDGFTGTIEFGSFGNPPGCLASASPGSVTFAEGDGPKTASVLVHRYGQPMFDEGDLMVHTHCQNQFWVNDDVRVIFNQPE